MNDDAGLTEKDVLSRIARRLTALRKADFERRVFGAAKHGYFNVPLRPDQIRDFEQQFGIVLPADYRQILLEVGVGGGPYFGIFGPAAMESELTLAAVEREVQVSPADSFPFTIEQVRQAQRRYLEGQSDYWLRTSYPTDGCVPICCQGCDKWTVLVTSAEMTGAVFDIDAPTSDAYWWLASRPPGLLGVRGELTVPLPPLSLYPDVQEWFIGWIEQCEADLSEELSC